MLIAIMWHMAADIKHLLATAKRRLGRHTPHAATVILASHLRASTGIHGAVGANVRGIGGIAMHSVLPLRPLPRSCALPRLLRVAVGANV